MMILQIIGHGIITVIAVVAVVVKVEHRLTEIETDITWLKNMLNRLNDCRDDRDGKE